MAACIWEAPGLLLPARRLASQPHACCPLLPAASPDAVPADVLVHQLGQLRQAVQRGGGLSQQQMQALAVYIEVQVAREAEQEKGRARSQCRSTIGRLDAERNELQRQLEQLKDKLGHALEDRDLALEDRDLEREMCKKAHDAQAEQQWEMRQLQHSRQRLEAEITGQRQWGRRWQWAACASGLAAVVLWAARPSARAC